MSRFIPKRPPPPPPPIPPSQLPQYIPPSRASRALQIGSFALATGLTFYAVLFYDFGPQDHVFRPVRKFFDDASHGFFTLSDNDRQYLAGTNAAGRQTVVPATTTPIEFFKERKAREALEAEKEKGPKS